MEGLVFILHVARAVKQPGTFSAIDATAPGPDVCMSLAGCNAERVQSAVEPKEENCNGFCFLLRHRTVKGLQGSGSMWTVGVSAAGVRVWPFQAYM